MKRLAYTTMLTTVALALAVGCSKEKKDDGQDKAAPAAAVKTPAKTDDAKTKPTLTATDTKKSKLLVLKFHHDS